MFNCLFILLVNGKFEKQTINAVACVCLTGKGQLKTHKTRVLYEENKKSWFKHVEYPSRAHFKNIVACIKK